MNPRPYSIRMFLPDGKPEGLRIVEKSNWTGQGVVCARSLLGEMKGREEFGRTGVYILVGTPEPGQLPRLYVGQGDVVRTRLLQHHSNKEFWDRVVFFTSKDGSLNRAHVTYLEARLVQLAKEAKRCHLDNSQTPQLPNLSEAEAADVESYLLDILSILPLLGIHAFESVKRREGRRQQFYLRAKGVEARGYEGAEGFVVEEGSCAVAGETPSMPTFLTTLRKELLDQGVLEEHDRCLVFSQSYAFNSPSMAASIVSGRNSNGRTMWKDESGRSLKEIQEAEGAEENNS